MRLVRALVCGAVVAAVVAPAARADTIATIPDGAWLDDVTVTPTGAVWVTGAGGALGTSRVGLVNAGAIAWRDVPIGAAPDLAGRVLPRPDGGIWALLRGRFALRSAPDGSVVRAGTVADAADVSGGSSPLAVTVQTDGALWAFPSLSELRRIGLDGRRSTRTIRTPRPPAETEGDPFCSPDGTPDDATVVRGGDVWVADADCERIVQLRPDGTTIQGLSVPAQIAGHWLSISSIAGAADGSVWAMGEEAPAFAQHLVGSDHEEAELPFFARPDRLVAAPDGSAWTHDLRTCSIVHLTASGTELLRTPFPVRSVAPAADGSVWLAGWSQLVHVDPATLPHGDPSELDDPSVTCGGNGPAALLPDAKGRTIRLSVLRRDGLRIASRRPGTAIGTLTAAGVTSGVQVAVGAQPGVARLSERVLDRLAARLRRGDRAVIDGSGIVVFDRNGRSGTGLPRKLRVVA